MGEHDSYRVAGASGDDRVDPDAGQIGAPDGDPRHALLRIRGGEHVPPGAARARHLEQVAPDREGEREERDRPELVEERVDAVEDSYEHRGCSVPRLPAGQPRAGAVERSAQS
jgi:hypothetical protein